MTKRKKLRDEKFAELVLRKESNQLANRLDPANEDVESQKKRSEKLVRATKELRDFCLESGVIANPNDIPSGLQSSFPGK